MKRTAEGIIKERYPYLFRYEGVSSTVPKNNYQAFKKEWLDTHAPVTATAPIPLLPVPPPHRSVPVHRFDTKGICNEDGDKAEVLFKNMMMYTYGYAVTQSSREEDMRQHIDCFLVTEDKKIGVDIKSARRVSRADNKPQDTFLWIELHGVNKGNLGWLYGGHADWIAFQRASDPRVFDIISRAGLVKYVDARVDKDKHVQRASDAAYCIYQRPGRMDMLSLVKREEVCNDKDCFIMTAQPF